MAAPEVEEMTQGMRARIGEDCGLNASLKIDLGPAGLIHLDATRVPNEVTNEDKPADCTIRTDLPTFVKIAKGELDGTSAFMQGKLRIEGDMAIAMSAAPILQAAGG